MTNKISSLMQSYKITLRIAGNKKAKLQGSFLSFIISYVFQGLAYALFYPLLQVLLEKNLVLDEALFYLGMIILSTLLSVAFRWHALNFSYASDLTDITHDLRMNLGSKIKTMPLQKLNKYRTGELNSILAQNVDDSVLHMGVVAGMAFETFVVPLIIIIATFFIDPRMAFAIILALPLSYPIYKWSRNKTKKEKADNLTAHASLEADTVEYLQGLPVLRSINQVGENSIRLQESIARVREVQRNGITGSLVPMVIMNTLIEFVFLMILALGAYWITTGSFSIAGLVALLIIVNRLSEPLANFLAISSVLDVMELGFKQIEKLLNIRSLKVHEPKATISNYDITFTGVDFNYLDYEEKALENININIPSNALTAIVGSSGSGKTTITRMIMRYDDPSKGNIEIGGVDIKNMTQKELMKQISVVFQDVYLFDDSILNNIRMGNPKASDEEVKQAATKAYCHEFISRLPHGYDTQVGEIGGSLSGGERQRISIARAILKDSPIVILDEPTSALDTQSEVAVQNALDELIAYKTVIVIAHRLSTISHADNIIVMDEGKVVENGTHEQLLKKEGKYSSMFNAQQRIKQWNLSHE